MSLPGSLNYTAGANVNPCRFVIQTAAGVVTEPAGATDNCIGISQEATRSVPYSGLSSTVAAAAGEPLNVYKVGETCLLEVSAAVAINARLRATGAADGRGVTGAAAERAFAVALRAAAGAGEKIPVLIIGQDTVNT